MRTLTPRLKNGGKTALICKYLRAWREKREHFGRDGRKLSNRLKAHIDKLGNEAFRIAQEDAALAYVQDREAAKVVRRAELVELEYLLGQLDQANAQAAASVARAEASEAEAARIGARLTKVENQLDRFRAEEFWDRVMREIYEILPASGTMHPDAILPELRFRTIRGAALHKEPLTVNVLKKKVDMRASHGKFFEKHPDWQYARRAG